MISVANGFCQDPSLINKSLAVGDTLTRFASQICAATMGCAGLAAWYGTSKYIGFTIAVIVGTGTVEMGVSEYSVAIVVVVVMVVASDTAAVPIPLAIAMLLVEMSV